MSHVVASMGHCENTLQKSQNVVLTMNQTIQEGKKTLNICKALFNNILKSQIDFQLIDALVDVSEADRTDLLVRWQT